MLSIRFNKRTIPGSMAKQLLKIGSRLTFIKEHADVDFGALYTTKLSDDYRYPRALMGEWIDLPDCRMECVRRKDKKSSHVILQLHGGAYVSGYSDTYRKSAVKLHDVSCGADIYTLDYRLAPKHPYPAALEDAVAAYQWLLNHGYVGEDIMILGDSAGGGLALALGLFLRDKGIRMPRAIITLSAWADLAAEGESYLRNAALDPLLGEGTEPLNALAYAGNANMLKHPYVSPAYGDFDDYTTLMMHVGTHEVLESDTITVAKKASEAGNDVTLYMYRGMFHVFQLAFNLIPEARKSWRIIRDFIQNQFGCEW